MIAPSLEIFFFSGDQVTDSAEDLDGRPKPVDCLLTGENGRHNELSRYSLVTVSHELKTNQVENIIYMISHFKVDSDSDMK